MSLLDDYKKSLKSLEIEEPIDVFVHRPLAYLLALALYPTPVSPNAVTAFSIVCGVTAGGCLVNRAIPQHMAWAGLFIFMSAVVDCADGQLARLRKTSSNFGRMLDGLADAIVSTVIVAGGAVEVLRDHSSSWQEWSAFALLVVLTAVTGSFHTASYDHYKNMLLRVTDEKYKEGEDMVAATARQKSERGKVTLFGRFVWRAYFVYVSSQDRFVLWYDPYTTRRLNALPAFDAERIRIYREHNAKTMRLWRGLFGFGTMVFGFALFAALDALDWYLILRGIGLNLLFFGWLMPRQRRASREGFAAMGVVPER